MMKKYAMLIVQCPTVFRKNIPLIIQKKNLKRDIAA
jgi:hypothetical protein